MRKIFIHVDLEVRGGARAGEKNVGASAWRWLYNPLGWEGEKDGSFPNPGTYHSEKGRFEKKRRE